MLDETQPLLLIPYKGWGIGEIQRFRNITQLNLSCLTWSCLSECTIFKNLSSLVLPDKGLCQSDDGDLSLLTQLTALKFSNGEETPKGLSSLTNLTFLSIGYYSRVTDEDVWGLTRLKTLEIGWKQLTDASVRMLTGLTSLDICDNETITGDAISSLTNLSTLLMYGNEKITDDAISQLTNLTTLSIDQTERITDYSLRCLTNLTELYIVDSSITSYGIETLTKLTTLHIGPYSDVDDITLASLFNLTDLNLEGNSQITDEGVRRLYNLKRLNVASSQITDKGLRCLSRLRYIDITNNRNITDYFINRELDGDVKIERWSDY